VLKISFKSIALVFAAFLANQQVDSKGKEQNLNTSTVEGAAIKNIYILCCRALNISIWTISSGINNNPREGKRFAGIFGRTFRE
jgi:hypothetical protein